MTVQAMTLKILLPFQVFAEKSAVTRLVVETSSGAMGILPRRLDCTALLVAGILCYETTEDGEIYLAVDQGVLVKSGFNVLISVRNAIVGADLPSLRDTVRREFLQRNEQQRQMQAVLAKLEAGFTRRFMEFHRD